MEPQKTAVVVGAGPAGIACAVFLAQRGFAVQVFERRPAPAEAGTPSSGRTFPLGLNGRTLLALKAADLNTRSLGEGAFPRKAIGLNGKLLPAAIHTDPLRRAFFVDRMRLGQDLVLAAKQKTYPKGGSIEWHFGQALEHVDLEARVATFGPWRPAPDNDDVQSSSAPPRTTTTKYDLLVGADGAKSVVRQRLLDHLPGLTARTQLRIKNCYKVFHGLKLSPAIEETLPGITALRPGEAVYFFRRLNKQHRGFNTLWKQADGTLSGAIIGPEGWYNDEELRALLDIILYGGMKEWRASVWEQVSVEAGTQAPSNISRIVKLNQFHGPSCVLIGDAAHPVTPSLGQGCNAAFESARVFAEALDKVGLEKAPAAFTAARLADAHALQDLDCTTALVTSTFPVLVGQRQLPPTSWQRFAAMVEMVVPTLAVWPLAKMIAPKRFPEPTLTFHLVARHDVSYAQARRIQQLLGWSVVAGGAAALTFSLSRLAGRRQVLW